MNEDNKITDKKVIETEVTMGTVHSAAIEPYRVRLFVEDEIVRDAEITVGINHRDNGRPTC
jgi:energy-converting hydrogenase B subunit N